MLKRSGAILLTVLYTVTVLGFALNLHYFGSKAASVKTNAPVINCNLSKTTGKTKCCKNTPVKSKVNDTYHDEATSFLRKVFAFELPPLPFKNFLYSPQQSVFAKVFDKTPSDEPSQGTATFIKTFIFRN
jgi:hypothetical protein